MFQSLIFSSCLHFIIIFFLLYNFSRVSLTSVYIYFSISHLHQFPCSLFNFFSLFFSELVCVSSSPHRHQFLFHLLLNRFFLHSFVFQSLWKITHSVSSSLTSLSRIFSLFLSTSVNYFLFFYVWSSHRPHLLFLLLLLTCYYIYIFVSFSITSCFSLPRKTPTLPHSLFPPITHLFLPFSLFILCLKFTSLPVPLPSSFPSSSLFESYLCFIYFSFVHLQ